MCMRTVGGHRYPTTDSNSHSESESEVGYLLATPRYALLTHLLTEIFVSLKFLV